MKLSIKATSIAMALALPVWIYLVFIYKEGYTCCNKVTIQSLVISIVIAPISEEIIFRGTIQGFLERKFPTGQFWGLSMPNIATNLAFALTHYFFRPNPSILLVFFPGLIFGYLRETQRSLTAPTVVHAFYNLGYALISPSK